MIKHLTWISGLKREMRVRPREVGDIPLSKLFLFFSSTVLYFYLGNRPASPYKLPFVPLISPRPLARTYLIRINARAAWKLASRPVRARHPVPRPTFAVLLPVSRSYVTTGNKPGRARCENPNRSCEPTRTKRLNRRKERERKGKNGSLKLAIFIQPQDHRVEIPF